MHLDEEILEDPFRLLVVATDLTGTHGEDLLAALSQIPDLRIRALAPIVPSLEDVFMAATRRSWDEVTDPLMAAAEPAPSEGKNT